MTHGSRKFANTKHWQIPCLRCSGVGKQQTFDGNSWRIYTGAIAAISQLRRLFVSSACAKTLNEQRKPITIPRQKRRQPRFLTRVASYGSVRRSKCCTTGTGWRQLQFFHLLHDRFMTCIHGSTERNIPSNLTFGPWRCQRQILLWGCLLAATEILHMSQIFHILFSTGSTNMDSEP